MLYTEKPVDFTPKFEVVSCFCIVHDKFLVLKYQDHKDYANFWGTPAGKIEEGEDLTSALIREMQEEIHVTVKKDELSYFTSLAVRYPEYDYMYHMFSTKSVQSNDVKISPKEHKDMRWVTPQEALHMRLVPDEDMCIKMYFQLPR